MGSPKSTSALRKLGGSLREARLRRRISIADLALRAGTSPSTVTRLEQGEPGVGVGTLCDILVVLGLIDRLGDLVDIRKDELGLALDSERLPRRGRSSAGAKPEASQSGERAGNAAGETDEDGVAF